jgi:hypothetical protein
MALWPSGPSKWVCGDHLAFTSYKIAHHVRKGNGRLAISMPPRHGKSRLVSEAAIPWFLEEFPEKHVILISYNGDKAQEWGRKARDIIKNREDLFSVKVREDMARTDRFETDTGSEAHFVGVTGHSGRGKNSTAVHEVFTRMLLTGDCEPASSRYLDVCYWALSSVKIQRNFENMPVHPGFPREGALNGPRMTSAGWSNTRPQQLRPFIHNDSCLPRGLPAKIGTGLRDWPACHEPRPEAVYDPRRQCAAAFCRGRRDQALSINETTGK